MPELTELQQRLCQEWGVDDLPQLLAAVLRATNYNQYQAALRLGISYLCFRKWMRKAWLKLSRTIEKRSE